MAADRGWQPGRPRGRHAAEQRWPGCSWRARRAASAARTWPSWRASWPASTPPPRPRGLRRTPAARARLGAAAAHGRAFADALARGLPVRDGLAYVARATTPSSAAARRSRSGASAARRDRPRRRRTRAPRSCSRARAWALARGASAGTRPRPRGRPRPAATVTDRDLPGLASRPIAGPRAARRPRGSPASDGDPGRRATSPRRTAACAPARRHGHRTDPTPVPCNIAVRPHDRGDRTMNAEPQALARHPRRHRPAAPPRRPGRPQPWTSTATPSTSPGSPANGCDGVVPNGSLGEYQTLTPADRARVVETAVAAAPEGFVGDARGRGLRRRRGPPLDRAGRRGRRPVRDAPAAQRLSRGHALRHRPLPRGRPGGRPDRRLQQPLRHQGGPRAGAARGAVRRGADRRASRSSRATSAGRTRSPSWPRGSTSCAARTT